MNRKITEEVIIYDVEDGSESNNASILAYSSTGGKEVTNQNPWDQMSSV